MPENRCSNCLTYSFDCTYVEAAKKRGPSKGYVERLENRLEKLEALLIKMCPDDQTLKQLDETFPLKCSPPLTVSVHPTQTVQDMTTNVIRSVSTATPEKAEESLIDGDFDNQTDQLRREFAKLHVKCGHSSSLERTFMGNSSSFSLMRSAFEAKDMYAGLGASHNAQRFQNIRSEFWTIRPWERDIENDVKKISFAFPPPDLLSSLTRLYFSKFNFFLPLLHRPSFERSIALGLHYTDVPFALIVLLVCALGSRYSNDERVKLGGEDSWHSAGWEWFKQVKACQRPMYKPVVLEDLQICCLSAQYVQGSSLPHCCWTMVGIGIRLAQEVGAHRKGKDKNSMTLEDELWKRAFWILVAMDRFNCAGLGRPCAIVDEDMDVDFPVECDDEYWVTEDSGSAPNLLSDTRKGGRLIFRQPPDKPSLVTAFVVFLKLNQVLAVVLRTIYSLKKSRIALGFVGPRWEQHIVSELDSALNHWVDCIPDHLRWDPNREHTLFFNQSAILYCMYYHVRLLVHRPFIPTPGKPSTTSFPSLAICTNAARACSHVADVQRKRQGVTPFCIQMAALSAGFVLLLNIWGGKKSGVTTDPVKDMGDVHKCMHVLKVSETRWNTAGKLWDIFHELLYAGDLPLPPSPPLRNKRERDSDSPASHASPASSNTSNDPADLGSSPLDIHGQQHYDIGASRTMAGSKRVSRQQQLHDQGQVSERTLPLYSNELGGNPLSASQSYWALRNWASHEDSMRNIETVSRAADQPLREQSVSSLTALSVSTSPFSETIDSGAYGFDPTASGLGGYAVPVQNPSIPGLGDPVLSGMEAQFGSNIVPIASSSGTATTPAFFNDAHCRRDSSLFSDSCPTTNPVMERDTNFVNLDAQTLMDQDMFSMLSSVAPGFEIDNWGACFANMDQMAEPFSASGHQVYSMAPAR